jgi:hypothetical protein
MAPLVQHTVNIVWYILLAVPVLLFLAFGLTGSGRIARDREGQLDLAGILAPHILLILMFGLCTLGVGIYYVAMFLVQVPLLMSARAPADPLVCVPSTACGHLWYVMYLGLAAIGLLPIDTLNRFLKQRGNRSRSYFLSYKQDDMNCGAVQMLYQLLDKAGSKAWLDKQVEDRSQKGMVDGVKESDVFVAIISPKYFTSYYCCLEMHTALSKGKRVLVAWNQSKFKVQEALGWIPLELEVLKSNELLPIMEDIQMAKTCVARITAADSKVPDTGGLVPSTFGNDPKKNGDAFVFEETASGTEVEDLSS